MELEVGLLELFAQFVGVVKVFSGGWSVPGFGRFGGRLYIFFLRNRLRT